MMPSCTATPTGLATSDAVQWHLDLFKSTGAGSLDARLCKSTIAEVDNSSARRFALRQ
jgi:hypothetical protein